MVTFLFGDENAVEKRVTAEADDALTLIEAVPEFNTMIVLLKVPFDEVPLLWFTYTQTHPNPTPSFPSLLSQRMIMTLESFKCNEIPAKQFRIMMLKVFVTYRIVKDVFIPSEQ